MDHITLLIFFSISAGIHDYDVAPFVDHNLASLPRILPPLRGRNIAIAADDCLFLLALPVST
jgi:hypothetical protein